MSVLQTVGIIHKPTCVFATINRVLTSTVVFAKLDPPVTGQFGGNGGNSPLAMVNTSKSNAALMSALPIRRTGKSFETTPAAKGFSVSCNLASSFGANTAVTAARGLPA
jgi:hypothetical protein